MKFLNSPTILAFLLILNPLCVYALMTDNDVDNPNHFASGKNAINLTGNGVNVPLHDKDAENILDGTFLRWSNSLKLTTSFAIKNPRETKVETKVDIKTVVENSMSLNIPIVSNDSNITEKKEVSIAVNNVNTEQKSAEEQLLLRNLLSQSKKIRTEFAINYGTQQNNSSIIDNTTGKNITSEENQQTLQPTATIRYGITPNLEIYSRLIGNWSKKDNNFKADNTYFGGSSSTTNSLKLQNLRFGLNYRVWNNDNSGVLGLFETSILERNTGLSDGNESKYSPFRSQIYGMTAYRSLEPLVLSITGIYGSNMKRLSQRQYNPANYWLLQPTIAFNPNDNMTLSFGPQWLKTQATSKDSEVIAPATTKIDWTWNFAWALDSDNTLNFSGNSGQYQQIQNVNGSNRDINFSWLKQWN